MKKVFAAVLSLLCTFALFSQAKGYYEQDSRKSEPLVVFSSDIINGNEDGTDFYIAQIIRKAVVDNLTIYSNYNVIDLSETDFFQKEYYTKPTPQTAAKEYNAKYAITIDNIIEKDQNNSSFYKIDLSLHEIENDQKINAYTSAIQWNKNEYIEYAPTESVLALLPLIDITLTPTGERQLSGTKYPDTFTVDDCRAEIDDIKLQIQRTNRKNCTKTALKTLENQKNIAETHLQQLVKKQHYEEEEIAASEKRDDESKQWIEQTHAKIELNKNRHKSENNTFFSIKNHINIIETKKQLLNANKNFVAEKIAANNIIFENQKIMEQEERKNKRPESFEVDAFGNLNENARVTMQKDLILISNKYNDKKTQYAKDTEDFYLKAQDKAATQINDDVNLLSTKTFTATSQNEEIVFSPEYYDGDKQGWHYSLDFWFDGLPVFSHEGLLSYKAVTQTKAPSASELIISKNRESYTKQIDRYTSLLHSPESLLEAKLYYKVTSEDHTKPSAYNIEIIKIEIVNLATEKVIEAITPAKKISYIFDPVTDVDWRTVAAKTAEIKQIENKKEEQKNRIERLDRQSKRITWGALFVVPSVWNYYRNQDSTTQTLGYTLTFGLNNYVYLGASTEVGDLKSLYDLRKDFLNNIKDFEWQYTAVGQLGATYKVFDWMRLNLFGEYGKILKENGYGFGASMDLFIKHVGIFGGYTKNYTKTNKWTDKFTAGFEIIY